VAAVNTAAGLRARRCDAGLTGVVAGSKACIAGYSAAVRAHYRHIEEEWERRVEAGREEKQGKRREEKKYQESKVK